MFVKQCGMLASCPGFIIGMLLVGGLMAGVSRQRRAAACALYCSIVIIIIMLPIKP
jgi:hypothetical protein